MSIFNRYTIMDSSRNPVAESYFIPVEGREEEITELFVFNRTSQQFSREMQQKILRSYKRYKSKHQRNGECLNIQREAVCAIGILLHVRTQDFLDYQDKLDAIVEAWADNLSCN